jgi:hypothetical protein
MRAYPQWHLKASYPQPQQRVCMGSRQATQREREEGENFSVTVRGRDFILCIARENRAFQKHLNQAKLTIVNVVGPGLPCLGLSRADGPRALCVIVRGH